MFLFSSSAILFFKVLISPTPSFSARLSFSISLYLLFSKVSLSTSSLNLLEFSASDLRRALRESISWEYEFSFD